MGETQNLRHERVDKYDPLVGRFIRDIKTTDIPNIGHKGTPTTTADWDIATYTTDANHALYPYIFTGHTTNTASQFIIYNGATTTALAFQAADRANVNLVSNCNCPFFRVAPSSTVTIKVTGITSTLDTYAAFLIAKKEPIVSVCEN